MSIIPEQEILNKHLNPDEVVLRLLQYTTFDGLVSEQDFNLSSVERAASPQSLSVWAQTFTTPFQALQFFPQEKRTHYSHVTYFYVGSITSIRPIPEPGNPGNVPSLDVIWEPIAEQLPGALGHCGITGLVRVSNIANAKDYFKSLRSQLTDLAQKSLVKISEI